MQPIPEGTICNNCGEHPATIKWTEGAIAMIHGSFSYWCKGCALRAQIVHAEERVKALDDLRQELAKWEEDNVYC